MGETEGVRNLCSRVRVLGILLNVNEEKGGGLKMGLGLDGFVDLWAMDGFF